MRTAQIVKYFANFDAPLPEIISRSNVLANLFLPSEKYF